MKFIHQLWNHKWGLSVSAGILLGFSFSPFPFPFLAVIAFLLLYRLAELCQTAREAAYYSYAGFVVWNIITTYWLVFATVAGGVAAILANAAIMTIPFVIQRRILFSSLNGWIKIPLAATPWVTYEWLHLYWDLAWPWIPVANAFSTATWAVQYIEFTGYLSISFWVLCMAGFLFWGIKRENHPQKRKWMNAFWLSAATPVLLSLLLLWRFDSEPEDTIHVVVAQPNYDSYQRLAGYPNAFEPLQELVGLTNDVVSPQTSVILWPENAFMARVDQLQRSYLDNYLFTIIDEWEIPVITGATYFRYYLDEPPPRVHRIDQEGRPFNFFNSAVGYFPGRVMEVYEKNKLVPIVERLPFVTPLSYLPIPGVNWGDVSGYGKGRTMHLFEAGNTALPAVVCYDSVFPALVRESVKMGAGFIGVITNDGWWGDTSGHTQHYDFARLRAIETRRAVVRSANNGISGMINADGSPHSRTEYWTRTAFEIEVPVYTAQTFYVRFGEWFGGLMLFSTFIGWGWVRFRLRE